MERKITINKNAIFKELMKYKSFRESTPMSREIELNKAIGINISVLLVLKLIRGLIED